MSSEDQKGVVVTVELLIENFDRATLAAASLGETTTETINRAVAFYYEVMQLEPGKKLSWTFADGSPGALIRLR